MNQYTVGTRVLLKGQFVDAMGVPVDPTTVTVKMRTPDGVVADLVPSRDSTGVYSVPYTPAANGLHQYRFIGTGVAVAASEGNFLANTVFP